MAILNRNTYKAVEHHLYREKAYRMLVEEYYGNIGAPSAAQIRGKGDHSDRTARQALQYADPPQGIDMMRKWLIVFDAVRERYRDTRQIQLWDAYYQYKERKTARITWQRVCDALHISQSTFYLWRAEVVMCVAVYAAARELIELA